MRLFLVDRTIACKDHEDLISTDVTAAPIMYDEIQTRASTIWLLE